MNNNNINCLTINITNIFPESLGKIVIFFFNFNIKLFSLIVLIKSKYLFEL
jgi:hypothetical protein